MSKKDNLFERGAANQRSRTQQTENQANQTRKASGIFQRGNQALRERTGSGDFPQTRSGPRPASRGWVNREDGSQ